MKFCSCKNCTCKNCSCKTYSLFFETLGNQNRLHILNALTQGPKNVSEIITITQLEQTAISHALKRLERSGFVTMKKEGRFRIYEINHDTIEPLLKIIDKHTQTHKQAKA